MTFLLKDLFSNFLWFTLAIWVKKNTKMEDISIERFVVLLTLLFMTIKVHIKLTNNMSRMGIYCKTIPDLSF